jgi:alpha-1,3/alpha-1,6-mannosyltransferase
MRISILHLDLGIGGAEKLIVSMALALKDTSVDSLTKHDVTIYTTHHDKTHCFEETLNERE